jgi:hypothetical protein
MTAMQALKGDQTRDLLEHDGVLLYGFFNRLLELAWLAECRKTID